MREVMLKVWVLDDREENGIDAPDDATFAMDTESEIVRIFKEAGFGAGVSACEVTRHEDGEVVWEKSETVEPRNDGP